MCATSEGSPATQFLDDLIAKNAEKSEEILFPLQKMEGRQFDIKDGWSTRKQHAKCKQPLAFVKSGGHVWTFLFWGQEGRHPDALRLLVHMTGQRSSSLKSMPWPLNRLSPHGHRLICIMTWIRRTDFEWQWQKIHWSTQSKEIKIPVRLPAAQQKTQTAIGSTEYTVDF